MHLHSWQSTDPHDTQQDSYNNIVVVYNETFFDQPISSSIRLPNIDYLCTKLPINDQFWSIVPSLNELYSLTVSSHVDTFQSQLQTLLDRAPHLRSLTVNQNASVRELDLSGCEHYLNENECRTLNYSSLGVQCE